MRLNREAVNFVGLRRFCAAVCLGGVLALTGCGQDNPGDASPEPTDTPTTDDGSALQSPATSTKGTVSPVSGDPNLAGRLLYSRFDESTHTFLSSHTSRADGRGETEVALPGPEGGGRWSRAGGDIAVMTVLADDRIGTAIIKPDGTVERVLEIPDTSLNLVCTVWSPDDRRLACEGWDEAHPSRNGIYSVRSSDGGGLVRLTNTPTNMVDFPGDYSPDGTQFLFKRTTEEFPGPLMVVPTSGGQPKPLSDLLVEDPGRYSRDGTTILTSSDGHIVLLSAAGREIGQFAHDATYLFGAVWSPDGSHIAYSGDTGSSADIYTSLPDGTDQHQVTSTTDNEIRVEWGKS